MNLLSPTETKNLYNCRTTRTLFPGKLDNFMYVKELNLLKTAFANKLFVQADVQSYLS